MFLPWATKTVHQEDSWLPPGGPSQSVLTPPGSGTANRWNARSGGGPAPGGADPSASPTAVQALHLQVLVAVPVAAHPDAHAQRVLDPLSRLVDLDADELAVGGAVFDRHQLPPVHHVRPNRG